LVEVGICVGDFLRLTETHPLVGGSARDRLAEVFAQVDRTIDGGLFSGRMEVPRFSRIARVYLLHIGHLDWTKINPDIFGSMKCPGPDRKALASIR